MGKKVKVKRNFFWQELKALNDLYVIGKSNARIQDLSYIKYLIDDIGLIEHKVGKSKILVGTDAFRDFYEAELLENFIHYESFLETNQLGKDARRNYNEDDIKTLMFIADNKSQIIPNLTTQGVFSGDFFGKGSKYLKNKNSVKEAVCRVLGITDFPEFEAKEHQWRFVVDCPLAKAVVLCENLNFLKLPWKVQKNDIKLWYVGGNNIAIIDQIDRDEFKRPFFYSGDWDLAGLQIYCRIKAKLAVKGKHIELLIPNNGGRRLPVTSPHHYSKWSFNAALSGLNEADFTNDMVFLIKELIANDEWIEEESNNLMEMLNNSDLFKTIISF